MMLVSSVFGQAGSWIRF